MLNLGQNQNPQQNNGALNLSMSGAPAANQNPFGHPNMQATQQNGFMSGMMGGAGVNPNFTQQPVAPPSEIEIQMALLRSLAPIDRFIASSQMAVLIELLNNLITFSMIEILRNATFDLNEDDGTFKLDTTSLPSHLQTISGENVAAQFTTLQSQATTNVQNAELEQQQIIAYAQQSLMGGALQAALQDEGLMTRMGNTVGSVTRGFITGGR